MSIKSLFEDIADAIKDKNPNVTNVTPAEMPSAIRSIPSGSSTASGVSYDNTSSGLTASNVQDAIDELSGDVSTINSDLSELTTWKKANSFADVPNTANEICILAGQLSSGYGSSVTLPWISLPSSGVFKMLTYSSYYSASSYGYITLTINTGNRTIVADYWHNGRNEIAEYEVYYR